MRWIKIYDFIHSLIKNQIKLKEGYTLMTEFLGDCKYPVIDIDKLGKDFLGWLHFVILEKPIPSNINAIYFGLV